jgi:hypothetical protein
MIHGVTFPISAGMMALALLTGKVGQDDTAYFPPTLFDETVPCAQPGRAWPVMTDFRADWYGGHLRAAGEAPIFDSPAATLRFTWLRTFHAPVVIRLDTTAEGAVLMTATELSGKGGYDPGSVARRVERRLTTEDGAALVRMLDNTDVMSLASAKCDHGMDGAQWILESAGPEGYRFVDRWAPRDGAVRELGLHLIGLTGWTFDPVY